MNIAVQDHEVSNAQTKENASRSGGTSFRSRKRPCIHYESN